MQTKILYEDDHIVVVHKPAGIAVQSANIAQTDVESELKRYLAGQRRGGQNRRPGREELLSGKKKPPYLGMVHRLDQPVEGVLVFGKDKESTARLTKMLQKEELNKEYLVVVCGRPAQTEEVLTNYLGKADGRAVIAEAASGGKKAVLCYKLLKTKESEAGLISLLKVELETGRFHQIRAQLSHAGMPILGDVKYGGRESAEEAKKLGIRSAALCAWRIAFAHPATKKRMEYTVSPANPAFRFFDSELFTEQ